MTLKKIAPQVLLVENHDELRRDLKAYFSDISETDWEIAEARSLETGLDVVQARLKARRPINLIITDYLLDPLDERREIETEPRNSGLTLLKEAIRLDPNLMGILYTSNPKGVMNRLNALRLGSCDLVERRERSPMHEEILHRARSALRGREVTQQLGFLRRYFDPRLFESIVANPDLLKPRRRSVTIAFWDIRGFSKLCDVHKANPSLLAGFLREYCEAAARIIHDHNGVVDKFIGDGVMALFGALNTSKSKSAQQRGALDSIQSAISLRGKFSDICARYQDKFQQNYPTNVRFGLGCGIHTGEAIVGNVGTDFRDQFTALGPHVNVASRIEGKSDAGQILISGSTESRVRDRLEVIYVDEIEVKNIADKIQVFEVRGSVGRAREGPQS